VVGSGGPPDVHHDMTSLSELYPGAGYVDGTCIDGYNFGTARGNPHGWMTFDQIFSSTYSQIVNTIAPGKPMIIGEIASSEHGGSKATWIREMLAAIPRSFPMIRALVWFDVAEAHNDWPLESSSPSRAAFAAGIANSVYTTNSFAHLAAATILPSG
jgi:beta-mannanase